MHPLQSRLHCYSHKRLLGTQYRTENPKIGPDTIPTAFRNASGQTDNYYFTNWYLWSNLQNVFTPNDFCNRLSWESGSRRLAQTMHTDCSRGQVLIFVLDSWTLRTDSAALALQSCKKCHEFHSEKRRRTGKQLTFAHRGPTNVY